MRVSFSIGWRNGSSARVAAGVPARRFRTSAQATAARDPASREATPRRGARRYAEPRPSAFSLIEVIVAVGIFALGMVAVIGLFAPVARSVADTSDAERAARVADALRLKLRGMTLPEVAALLKVGTPTGHQLALADARADYELARDPQLLFAARDGTRLGAYADPIWVDAATRRNSDRDKFFEIALVRNEAVSPPASTTTDASGATVTVNPDATAPLLAYTARIRWPAYIGDGTATGTMQFGANPSGPVRFDHGKKSVLFISGTVAR
jgi:prepilin-type N-terminal cleavage/methylation domain-containing protein